MIALAAEPKLVQRYIEQDPNRRGPVEVRIKDYHVHVWALVGDLRACDFDVQAVAQIHEIPVEHVEAALAYYRRHPEIIDARLAENEA